MKKEKVKKLKSWKDLIIIKILTFMSNFGKSKSQNILTICEKVHHTPEVLVSEFTTVVHLITLP